MPEGMEGVMPILYGADNTEGIVVEAPPCRLCFESKIASSGTIIFSMSFELLCCFCSSSWVVLETGPMNK